MKKEPGRLYITAAGGDVARGKTFPGIRDRGGGQENRGFCPGSRKGLLRVKIRNGSGAFIHHGHFNPTK